MIAARPTGLNRKQRRELARRLRVEDPGLDVVHPEAAGIDIGNSAHYVAVRPDRDPDSVRRFDCFTADLHRLADWLFILFSLPASTSSLKITWCLARLSKRQWKALLDFRALTAVLLFSVLMCFGAAASIFGV